MADAIAKDLLNGDRNDRSTRIKKLSRTINSNQNRIISLQDSQADGDWSSVEYLEMKGRYFKELECARIELEQLESHDVIRIN